MNHPIYFQTISLQNSQLWHPGHPNYANQHYVKFHKRPALVDTGGSDTAEGLCERETSRHGNILINIDYKDHPVTDVSYSTELLSLLKSTQNFRISNFDYTASSSKPTNPPWMANPFDCSDWCIGEGDKAR